VGDSDGYVKKALRPARKPKRVSVDVPVWMVQAIDRQADMIGVSRQAFIKFSHARPLHQYSKGLNR